MKRIYDAAFVNSSGTHHAHLGTFWWVDDNGSRGTWTRLEAYNYVKANPQQVYVSEGNRTVYVAHRENNLGTKWVQTYADRYWRDNLTALAIRHRQGLPNY